MTSMIRSVSDAPIWKPTLPPSMRTVPGADQPARVLLRHDTNPFPYFAPTTKAAVFRSGTSTMQWAFSMRSSGMPLSGVAMISDSIVADSPSRLAGSESAASKGVIASVVATVVAIINFKCAPSL